MPGGHDPNTKLLGFYAHTDLVAKVDEARGNQARSDWMRDAVCDHIEAQGIKIPAYLRRALDRTGKGGPKKKTDTKKFAALGARSLDLEPASSPSAPTPEALELLQSAVDAIHPKKKSPRLVAAPSAKAVPQAGAARKRSSGRQSSGSQDQ